MEYSCDAYPKLLEVLQARPNDQTYGIVPMDFVGRNGWVAESLAFLADLKHSYSDCTVYTQPLIEQIVKSNDIFKR